MKTIFALFMCITTGNGPVCSGPLITFQTAADCHGYIGSLEARQRAEGVTSKRQRYSCLKKKISVWTP